MVLFVYIQQHWDSVKREEPEKLIFNNKDEKPELGEKRLLN